MTEGWMEREVKLIEMDGQREGGMEDRQKRGGMNRESDAGMDRRGGIE